MSQGAVGPIFSIPVTLTVSSNQTLVAAVAASGSEPVKKIRVLALYLTAAGTGTVTLHDGTPTAMSGAMNIGVGAPINLQPSEYGWGDTGEDVALQADATVAATGILTYQVVK